MKNTIIFPVLFLICFLFAGQQAFGAAPEWQFDTAHSSFNFGVKHIYSTVWGHFEDYSGTVLFDPDNLAESKMIFEIEVKSIQTGVGKRDNHLRSEEFFDVKKYPLITFVSTDIKHVEGDKYDVAGRLTIKDVSKDIVLPLIFHGIKDHPLSPGDLVAGFETSLILDRFEYHVGTGKFYELGVAGKDVQVVVYLEMLRKK